MSTLQGLPAGDAIGVLGGTFDPVHFGHLRAAVEVRETLGLHHFRLMPAGQPPHRSQPRASAEQRLRMLRLATAACPGLEVDDRETRRSGPSFMADTLREMREEVGNTPLILVVGQDAANALDSWHEWRDLFELAHIVVMRRPDARFQCASELRDEIMQRRVGERERLLQTPSGCVLPLEITQLDISSTSIRELIAGGRSPEFLLPDSVIEYIREQGLYGAG